MVFPQKFRSYLVLRVVVDLLCFHRFIAALYLYGSDSDKKNGFDQLNISYYGRQFGLSSAYYDVVLFVVLLRHFICIGVIQTGKTDSLSYILVVSMLKK